jgi:nicotinate-nucleotide pyrophosphorylase
MVRKHCCWKQGGGLGPIEETGVDFISSGALTHSARSIDITMEFDQ